MPCQYCPLLASFFFMACRRPGLALGIGCLPTSFGLVSVEYPCGESTSSSSSCTKHVREYGTHEGDWDYHQHFLPQELLWRQRNCKKRPDIKPDATNSQKLDSSPLQISQKTKQKQCDSQEVYTSKRHF